jgi:hypothetical protein
MAAVGDSVTASDYNNIRGRINTVTNGYYLPGYPGLNSVNEGDTIDDAHFDTLEQAITYLYLHQNGTDPGLTQSNAGDTILAGDGAGGTITRGYEDYSATLTDVEGGTANHAANQYTQTGTAGRAISTTAWGGGAATNEGGAASDPLQSDNAKGRLQITWTLDFGSTSNYNSFFALDCNIVVYARLGNSGGTIYTSDPGEAKRNWWYNHLNVVNPIALVINKAVLDAATTSYVDILTKSDSDDATYNMNRSYIALNRNAAATSFNLRMRFEDLDVAADTWPNLPIDEDVNASVITWCDMKKISSSQNAYVNTDNSQPSITNGGYTVVDI